MFGLLKNKLTSFIKGLAGREEQKTGDSEAKPVQQPEEEIIEKPVEIPQPEPIKARRPEPVPVEIKKPEPMPRARQAEIKIHSPSEIKKPIEIEKPVEEKKHKPIAIEGEKPKQPEAAKAKHIEQHAHPETKKETPVLIETKQPQAESPKKKAFEIPFLNKLQHKPVVAPEAKQIQKAPEPAKPVPEPQPQAIEPAKPVLAPQPEITAPKPIQITLEQEKPATQKEKPAPVAHKPKKETSVPPKPAFAQTAEQGPSPAADLSRLGRKAASDKKEITPKIGIGTAIKSFFTNEITISEAEVSDLLEELELSLLEADVAYDVSLEVTSQLRQKLVGMTVPKKEVGERTKEAVQGILESVMDSEKKFDFLQRIKDTPKPVKILFVGPNGAGKTTTMAKVAHMLLQAKLTAVFSASDTFRAAAIEQTEVHAERLGLKVIKSKYGADPSSVAFDAISYAKAHNIDVVLIDSAGRQDTNANLLDELRKINRVAKPDIKIYIGESIGGNSIIEQIKAFDSVVGMDGAILTKIDCDAKGGTAISVAKSTGIPVLFLGTGQGYSDLVPFDPHKIAQEIMG